MIPLLWLSLAVSAAETSFKTEIERPLPPCRSKLDTLCGETAPKGGWISFAPAQGRERERAITIRFGDPKPGRTERVEVKYGPIVQHLLFIAALIATFAL